MPNKTDSTEEWNDYESGIDYNNQLGYYDKTKLHWRFYNDKQWEGIKTNGLPTCQFNICKAAIKYFIAAIMSQKTKMMYSAENIPDNPVDPKDKEIKDFVDKMSKVSDMKWEKDKMDSKLRELLLDAANSGDMCAYVYWDETKGEFGDFRTKVIDGANVYFGNPNIREVEDQPYILIVGRETVAKLKKEAKNNGIPEDKYSKISPDDETQYQASDNSKYELNKTDDNGKCLYIVKFYKENGYVYWNKSTKNSPIRKDVNMGIKLYPIAWGNWDTIKNSYHGNPPMSGIIPNQIVINQLFAMVTYWMRMMAFGKVVYDSSKINGWSSKIGEAVQCTGDVQNVIKQLDAGNFNQGILQVIDIAIKYTKDFIGASDAALGQVKPENTSAIIAVQKAAAVPLENVQANAYQFVEDLGLIWGEFMLRKYTAERKISYKVNSSTEVSTISSEPYQDIMLSVKIDVGPSTYWSEVMAMQTLDNLLLNQKIDIIQYLERVPDGIIPKRQELINELKQQMQQAQVQQQQIEQGQIQQEQVQQENQNAQYEKMAQFLESLPPDVQDKITALPAEQQEQATMQLMKQSISQSMKGGGMNAA